MRTLLLTLLTLSACGSDSEPFENCTLGELTGAWRISYSEDDGTCGPLADETIVFDGSGGEGCEVLSFEVSEDQCEGALHTFCTDGSTFEQDNVLVLTQTGEDTIEGTFAVMYADSSFSCRSTYDVDMRQQ